MIARSTTYIHATKAHINTYLCGVKWDIWRNRITILFDRQCKYTYKDATKRFDYTTITDRLITVSWRDNSHLTGVLNLMFKCPTFPPSGTVVQSKGQTFNKFINIPPYRDHARTNSHLRRRGRILILHQVSQSQYTKEDIKAPESIFKMNQEH